MDGFSRLAYTEALEDERAVTTIGFYCRARAFFTAHGIRIDRVITDNGNNYRAAAFTAKVVSRGHHRIRPYTPKHNGKVERYDHRLMVDEVLYARLYSSEQARREALEVWVNHYNYHRPDTSCGTPGLVGPGPCQQRHDLLHLVEMGIQQDHLVSWQGEVREFTRKQINPGDLISTEFIRLTVA